MRIYITLFNKISIGLIYTKEIKKENAIFFFFFYISNIHVFFSFNFCLLGTILFSMPRLIFWAHISYANIDLEMK
jgi:hypothetical protein